MEACATSRSLTQPRAATVCTSRGVRTLFDQSGHDILMRVRPLNMCAPPRTPSRPLKKGARSAPILLVMFNLSQMISKPTRVTRDSSSLLDVILTTNPHQVIQTTIKVNSISDHSTISALLRLKAPKPHRSRILIRAYKNYGSEKFSEDI